MEKHPESLTDNDQQTQKKHEITYYKRIIQRMPEFAPFCINARLKLANLYVETGEREAATQEYLVLARHYMQNGALLKAIAIQKILSKLAPEREQEFIKSGDIYFQKSELTEPLIEDKDKPTSVDETIEEYLDHSSENPLARVPLFNYLNTSEQRKIMEFLSHVKVEKETIIIQEGEIGDCMYVIKSGEVGVYTTLFEQEESEPSEDTPQQDLFQLATLRVGDFFGEHAILTDEPRNATIIALTNTELLRLAKADLAAIANTYPRIEELLRRYHHQRDAATIASLKSAIRKVTTQDPPDNV